MISAVDFKMLVDKLGAVALRDIAWAENLLPPVDAEDFALEAIFVICNSGMKNTVARLIFDRIKKLFEEGKPVQGNVLGKSGKAAAIDGIWRDRERLFREYTAATDKLGYAMRLPWIGGITAYHLVKNFGADVAKPDVHLKRLADREGVTSQQLCARLAGETGYRIATVDTVLWRACALGVIDSPTGLIDWSKPLEDA